MTEQNGHPASPAAAPDLATETAQRAAIVQQITPGVRVVSQTMVQGLLVGYNGALPAHVLLQLIAFEVGMITGVSLNTPDIAGRLQLRTMFLKAFEDGLKKAPLVNNGNWQPPAGEKVNGG